MVKVYKLRVTIKDYHELVAVTRKDIVEAIPSDLFPFIDWRKLPSVDYIAATLCTRSDEVTKVYLSREPIAVVLKDRDTQAYEVHISAECSIPDEIAVLLDDGVRKKLGLVEEKEKEEKEEEEGI